MHLRVEPASITDIQADAIIVNLFEGVTAPGGATGAVDAALGGALTELIASGEMKGKLHETTLLHVAGKPFRRVLVIGLGKKEEFTLERVAQVSGAAARALRDKGCKTIASIVHGAGIGGLDPAAAAMMVVKGTLLGDYDGGLHKSDGGAGGKLETLILAERDADRVPMLRDAAQRGQAIGEAVNWARDLVNEPGNVLTPREFADRVQAMAGEYGLEITIYAEDALREMGAQAILGVARGSEEPPRLVVLRHPGEGPLTAFVGKGITFDSGGISIKPGENMHTMKGDMAGAAAVAGALRALAATGSRANVVGVLALAENLPGGRALKPGDVIRALNGKTIEVQNTDAEGRLVLADALAHAAGLGAARLVDLATLTGACIIALGHLASGVMGTDQSLIDQIRAAGDAAGERTWQLPLWPEYREQMKSDVADIRNIGGRPAGTITGGIFLKEFAGEKPWAHLDIAGTAWRDENTPYAAKGGTGVGVHTLVNLADA